MIILHDPVCASYAIPSHPENPARVTATERYLAQSHPEFEWRRPTPPAEQDLLRAHTADHLARLEEPRDFDADTYYFERVGDLARLATGSAIDAAELARAGHPTFSLMRPPGHHATGSRAMGFCYLNHVAIAAIAARDSGVERVAIWDFDAHHGNGTETILRGCEGTRFVSVHQYPCYPGTGGDDVDNCRNFPVPPRTPADQHVAVLRESWQEVLDFKPGLVLVSAGFDAYQKDPITEMTLRLDDFHALGVWIHEANLPTAAVLEGGYSADLPLLIRAFLEGWHAG